MLFFTSKDRGPKILGMGLYRGKEYVGPWSCIVYAGNMASVTEVWKQSEAWGHEVRAELCNMAFHSEPFQGFSGVKTSVAVQWLWGPGCGSQHTAGHFLGTWV